MRPKTKSRMIAIAKKSQRTFVDELYQRYGGIGFLRSFHFWRKKYAWIMIVNGARAVKRLIDIVTAAAALVLLTPLFILVSLCIKLTDNGPILYWQTRVGRWGREFWFPKFRSMIVDADKMKDQLLALNDLKDSVTFKMKRDPRITWIGRIIRKTSIDELPQLWCVLKGDMSLVGPRPPVPKEVEQYTLSNRRRLEAIPGLTCIWQVSGRGDIPFPQQVELDVQYIESQSLWLDLKILLKTIPAIITGRGAY